MSTFPEQPSDYQYLTQAFQHSPIALLLVDAAGLVQRWNSRASNVFALPEFSDDSSRPSLESIICKRSHPILVDLKTAVSGSFLTVRIPSPAGESASQLISLGITRFTVQDSTCFLVAIRPEAHILRTFKTLNNQLEAANKQAATERARIQVLEQKNEELAEYSSATAHDLKTPLVQIDMLLNCVREEYALSVPDDALALIDRASMSVQSLGELIDQTLDQVRSDGSIEKQTIDLDKAVHTVSESIDVLLRDINGVVSVQAPLGLISGNPYKLHQLLSNLLSNSIKYRSPSRTLIIDIFSERRDGNTVALRVKDNGIGFYPRLNESLFEHYHRLDESTTEGQGIGLFTSRRICESQQWKLQGMGKDGEGADFRIEFQATPSYPASNAA